MSVKAMKAGAVDFLIKPFRDQDLLDAVAAASNVIARASERRCGRQPPRSFSGADAPEQQVMSLVTRGWMNKNVAAETGLSEITVKIYRGHVYEKDGARSLPIWSAWRKAWGFTEDK